MFEISLKYHGDFKYRPYNDIMIQNISWKKTGLSIKVRFSPVAVKAYGSKIITDLIILTLLHIVTRNSNRLVHFSMIRKANTQLIKL